MKLYEFRYETTSDKSSYLYVVADDLEEAFEKVKKDQIHVFELKQVFSRGEVDFVGPDVFSLKSYEWLGSLFR